MQKKIKTKIIKLAILGTSVFTLSALFLFSQFFSFDAQAQNSQEIQEEISQLNEEIQEKKNTIDNLNRKKEIYEKNINIKRQEIVNLSNQLSILESQIAKTELELEETQVEIDRANLEIKNVKLHIKDKENKITRQKERLSEFIRLIDKADQRNYLEILILNDSFSEFYNQLKYIGDIKNDLHKALTNTKLLKEDLEFEKSELDNKKSELEDLKDQIEEKKAELDSQRGAKQVILTETRSSERKFESLLAQLKQEQAAINNEITGLESKVREELKNLEMQKGLNAVSTGQLNWPVPSRYITAYFHDPDYPFRYIFEHPAIDIRASQGTPIKAADGGYIARAADNGFGYSYIMIVHDNGLSTVYGHVSRIDVREEDYVYRGQVIGLSGGMPGTPGAGRLSTGPHLHFEVRLNGIPVNPLEYLP